VSHAKWWTIVWAPAVARLGSSIALATLPPARAEGVAFRLAGRRSSGAFVVAALPIIAMLPFVIREGVVAIVGGLAAALFVPRALSRWLGGITGDLVGAGIVLVEVTTLLACALAAR
jgi:adenosylcobinamide-GDP ribazoletransferase